MTVEESVIYLVSCAVNGEVPDIELVSAMNQEKVMKFARKHKISCCVAMAFESAGVRSREIDTAITTAIRRNALFENSLKDVTERLEAAGIWYVLLKGIILKKYYPKPFMREMADHDIWIDASRAADVKQIMEELGFTTREFGVKHHDIYRKEPVMNFEMHRELFEHKHDPQKHEYYYGKTDLNRAEDFYLYTVAHEYKHYSGYGTGLRSLLDIYLYLKKETLDLDYVQREAEKLGIREFERENRQLAVSLFRKYTVTDLPVIQGQAEAAPAARGQAVADPAAGAAVNEQMLANILSSGAQGSFAHKVETGINRVGGKRELYMLKRFSVPLWKSDPEYRGFEARYPVFYKYKILLPLLPFYRIGGALKTGKFTAEWKEIWNRRKETPR